MKKILKECGQEDIKKVSKQLKNSIKCEVKLSRRQLDVLRRRKILRIKKMRKIFELCG